MCVHPANRWCGGRTQGTIKRGNLPPFFIYTGKNVDVLVLLIHNVLFDVVAFTGLEMPISHPTAYLWSENTQKEKQLRKTYKYFCSKNNLIIFNTIIITFTLVIYQLYLFKLIYSFNFKIAHVSSRKGHFYFFI